MGQAATLHRHRLHRLHQRPLPPLLRALDLGLNYMGSGRLSTTSQGNFQYKDKRTNTWKTLTSAQLETALRHEGHDFFKLADHLHVYPVLQLSIGLQF